MTTTTYHRLTLIEREQISQGIWAEETFTAIAERINFDISCVSGEVERNVKRKRYYSAIVAQKHAEENNKRKGRKKKIEVSEKLKNYVYEKLKLEWSPEEIAKRIKLDYADDKDMRISHETIYQQYLLPSERRTKKRIDAWVEAQPKAEATEKVCSFKKTRYYRHYQYIRTS